ncbi:MAG: fumarylacetoacetate hydrolase family protein [Puniceicoccaceae bacterium]
MYLTKHRTKDGPRWALDGKFLNESKTLQDLSHLSPEQLTENTSDEPASGSLLAPVEANQEVWAAGVTYLSSRLAREAESESADVYQKVYVADRPELFFKANGPRVAGPGDKIRIRQDSSWNVPEPELTLAINSAGQVYGYTIGNDVSSRSIEGANPLYLPQAKVYNGSCAIGPGICLCSVESMSELPIRLKVSRDGLTIFESETSTNQIKRSLDELVEYLFRELDFPYGCFLMTGTGIIPTDDFTLQAGDLVTIAIGDHVLENLVDNK